MTRSIAESRTVGELVRERPGRSRVFERLHIDYCCGGKRTLSEACGARGLDAQVVLRELELEERAAGSSTAEGPDWSAAPLADLADHIERTHHAYLRAELPRLTGLIEKVARAHGARHSELAELPGVFEKFRDELADHMVKEERVLFPWIRRLERGNEGAGYPPWSITSPVSCMEHEHEEAGRALERMRELTGGFEAPAEACNTWRAMLDGLAELEKDMHAHVHKENNILFPRAVELERVKSEK